MGDCGGYGGKLIELQSKSHAEKRLSRIVGDNVAAGRCVTNELSIAMVANFRPLWLGTHSKRPTDSVVVSADVRRVALSITAINRHFRRLLEFLIAVATATESVVHSFQVEFTAIWKRVPIEASDSSSTSPNQGFHRDASELRRGHQPLTAADH